MKKGIFSRLWIFFLLVVIISTTSAQPITFNFDGVDINNFISQVSELTGKNFVVDPRVRGKITVISAKPLTQKEIYQVFLSVLEVHGFSAVPSGEIIKIVPNSEARQDTIPTDNAAVSGNQMVTRVVQIKNVSAAQLIQILRPLMPQHAHLSSYDSTNTLLITDRAANVERLLKIIERVDQVSDAEVDVVSLKHASAAEIVRIMTSLQQANIQPGRNVQHQIRFAADVRTNSVLLTGERSTRLRMRTLITHMDTPLPSSGNTHVVYLRYVNAKDMVTTLTGVSNTIDKDKKKGQPTGNEAMAVSILADEANNALVITAPPDIFRSLQQVVAKLDIRRAQVLVEAIIAEVSVDKANELGVQWLAGSKRDGKDAIVATSNNSNSSSGGIVNMAAAIQAGNVPSIGDGLHLGLAKLTGAGGFGALISALKSDTNTNVLSTPSILTLDNKQAEIRVGQNVPFITGSFTNNGAGSTGTVNPFQTIQRQDVGLKLVVKPQINEGSAIMLEIDQEVSSISPSTTASDIVTNKRTIKTTVMVENGHAIVLGGLIDERLTQSKQKVPFLGSIPLLGKLFQYNKSGKEKRNLMVFLRPTIVNDAATQQDVTNSKYQYIRQEQLQQQEAGALMLKKSDAPILPEKIDDLIDANNDAKKALRKFDAQDTKSTSTKQSDEVESEND